MDKKLGSTIAKQSWAPCENEDKGIHMQITDWKGTLEIVSLISLFFFKSPLPQNATSIDKRLL